MNNTKDSARKLVNGTLALLGTALAAPSHAAWEATPMVEIIALTDDNLRLVPEDQPLYGSAEATSIDARLRAVATGQRGNFFIEPRLRADQYTGDQNEDLNGTDVFLRARSRYSWTQVQFDFLADFDQQDMKDAELTEALPDDPNVPDPIDPDTGLVLLDQDRKRVILRPSLDVRLSERSSLVLETEMVDISYTGAEIAGRVDFTNLRAAAGIRRNVDARNQVMARLVAAEYEADFNDNQTKTFGVEGMFDRALGRDWRFNLTAGVNRSDYSFLNERLESVDNADTSFVYAVGFRQRGVQNTINVDFSRETTPNSNGFLSIRDQVRAFVSRAMTQRLRGEVGFRINGTKTLDDAIENDDRDYLRLDLGVEWAITEQLFLNGGYAFTSQKFGDDADDATGNSVFVGFAYRGRSR